jgi:hypothetical protein
MPSSAGRRDGERERGCSASRSPSDLGLVDQLQNARDTNPDPNDKAWPLDRSPERAMALAMLARDQLPKRDMRTPLDEMERLDKARLQEAIFDRERIERMNREARAIFEQAQRGAGVVR